MELHPSLSIIDSSKLNDWISCPRYFFYRHVLGWKPIGVNHNLIFGEAMHAALEVLYRHGFTEELQNAAYIAFLDVYREWFPEETDDDYPAKNPWSASEAIEGYCRYYLRDRDRFEVLTVNGEKAVEVSGFAPITRETRLYFRQDVILRSLEDGRIRCREHKTASRGGHTWAAQWELSVQVGTYTHALYSLFPPNEVYGVEVNGIIFLKREQRFERVPCERTFDQMSVWLDMVRHYASHLEANLYVLREDEVLDEQRSDDVMRCFRQRPDSCTKWNRVCEYHDFCTSWPNPLQRMDEVPLGFEEEWWDPQDRKRVRVEKPTDVDPFAGMESDLL